MARDPRTMRQYDPVIPGKEWPWMIGGEDVNDRALYKIVRQLSGQIDDLNTTVTTTSSASGLTPPVDTDFTWVNQGSATTTQTTTGVFIQHPASAVEGVHCRVQSLPATDYTITMAFIPMQPFIDFSSVGICLRESGSGKLVTAAVTANSFYLSGGGTQTRKSIYPVKWSSATVAVGDYATLPIGVFTSEWSEGANMWLRLQDAGGSFFISASNDGENFSQFFSGNHHDYLSTGADQYGFFVRNFTGVGGYTVGMNVLSLTVT